MTKSVTQIESPALLGHLIDGKPVVDHGRTQPVYNPATGEEQKLVALASQVTMEQAIGAAQAAYPAWRATPSRWNPTRTVTFWGPACSTGSNRV